MAEEQRSLRSVFQSAEQGRRDLENRPYSDGDDFQGQLSRTIQLYEECLEIARRVALFSPNETLEDISSTDLPYLLLHYRLAELLSRVSSRGIAARKERLEQAQKSYEQYLKQLDDYDMLSKGDAALLESYLDSRNTFSTVAASDAAVRRETKIRRFKEEKELRQKLEYLSNNPTALANDDAALRDLQLTAINHATHQTFEALESIARELHMLSLAPPEDRRDPQMAQQVPPDTRERNGGRQASDSYSERLDAPPGHLSAGLRGPLLDSKGKPLRPFTLTSSRQEVQAGVFRPDHSLPTMSIDEYLEEERRRGGIIEGGGPQSGIKPEVDEDDMDVADAATMKAREWDEFTEANPRGSGNTINRG